MPSKRKGFSYTVNENQIAEYRRWPVERRLKWLFEGNKIRRYLPQKTLKLHEEFRKGAI
jgi:hypothetical protein